MAALFRSSFLVSITSTCGSALSRIDGTADVASYIAALGAAEKAAGAA